MILPRKSEDKCGNASHRMSARPYLKPPNYRIA